jgi:phospholipase C
MCANHNYDLSYFYHALNSGNLPAVTYLKFSENDTGHPSDSTPLLEQTSIVNAINAIERSPFWQDTAIMITYDDSDGWYDHVTGPIVNFSQDPINDAISGNPATSTGACGNPGPGVVIAIQDRCGFGVRLPFLLISPYAKRNYVDHSLNDTT